MKSKTKFLAIHKRLLKNGVFSLRGYATGICRVNITKNSYRRLECDDVFHLITPTRSTPHAFWGSGSSTDWKMGEYTPLRQNLILLCAAMNNEL
jgi:hypothetical protein